MGKIKYKSNNEWIPIEASDVDAYSKNDIDIKINTINTNISELSTNMSDAYVRANNAADNANQAAQDIRDAAARGDFDGDTGPAGPQGERGPDGQKGEPGVGAIYQPVANVQWMDWAGYTDTWSYLGHSRKAAVAIWPTNIGTKLSLTDTENYVMSLRIYSYDNKVGMCRWAIAGNSNGDAANFLQRVNNTTDDIITAYDGYAVVTLSYRGADETIPTGYESIVSIEATIDSTQFADLTDNARFEVVPLGNIVRWSTSATNRECRGKTQPVQVFEGDTVMAHTIHDGTRMQIFSDEATATVAYNTPNYVTGDVYSEDRFVTDVVRTVPASGWIVLDVQGWGNRALPYTYPSTALMSVQRSRLSTGGDAEPERTYHCVDVKNSQITNLKQHDISVNGNTTSDMVVLAHMTDPHGRTSHITLVKWLLDKWGDFIDAAVCSGDLAQSYFGNGIAFWGSNNPIMPVVGNHDTLSDPATPRQWDETATQQQLYETYFAPHLTATGITIGVNETWWYRDVGKLRVIGLNTDMYETHDATAIANQGAWLVTTLESARTDGKAVVIVMHRTGTAGSINLWKTSNWCHPSYTDNPGMSVSTVYSTIYPAVDAFIEAGGVFCCYLVGHQHHDSIGNIRDTTHPQPFITGNCAYAITGTTSDVYRVAGTDSEYSLNLVSCNCKTGEVRVLKIGADTPYSGKPRKFIRFLGTEIREEQ